MNVLDPMVGTGSTLIACIRSGRNGYGIELNQKYAEIAKKEVRTEMSQLPLFEEHPKIQVFNSDAKDILQLNIPKYSLSL